MSPTNAKAGQLSQKLAMERRTSSSANVKGNPNERMMVSCLECEIGADIRMPASGTSLSGGFGPVSRSLVGFGKAPRI